MHDKENRMINWIMPTQRSAWKKLCLRWSSILFFLFVGIVGIAYYVTDMPGKSYQGPLLPLSDKEQTSSTFLRQHIEKLAHNIGKRSLFTAPQALYQTETYIEQTFKKLGYQVHIHPFQTDGGVAHNLWVTLPGTSPEILVIGAHYDSDPFSATPGANDNATGVAALLELARLLVTCKPIKTLYLVAFANEEPPSFATNQMGSHYFAQMLKETQLPIFGMWSLETIGYYREQPGSQHFPIPLLKFFYPDRGNFIAFVGNLTSRSWVRQCIQLFRQYTDFPSEGIAAPQRLVGIDFSDHRSFWEQGWPALMVTDTAPFRYPYYHTLQDTPDKIDNQRIARIVWGFSQVIKELLDSTIAKAQ